MLYPVSLRYTLDSHSSHFSELIMQFYISVSPAEFSLLDGIKYSVCYWAEAQSTQITSYSAENLWQLLHQKYSVQFNQ